jgi:hypothetical protein
MSQKATAARIAEWSSVSSSSVGCSSIAEALTEYPRIQIIPTKIHSRCKSCLSGGVFPQSEVHAHIVGARHIGVFPGFLPDTPTCHQTCKARFKVTPYLGQKVRMNRATAGPPGSSTAASAACQRRVNDPPGWYGASPVCCISLTELMHHRDEEKIEEELYPRHLAR